jgi:hypothetical protein
MNTGRPYGFADRLRGQRNLGKKSADAVDDIEMSRGVNSCSRESV